MNFASIRWRLPFSYAAVALLAALSLGSLMLLVLNDYYSRQERDFLLGNAEAARSAVEQVLQSRLPEQALQDQVRGLGFLSQTQIRVLDAGGKTLADSGAPDVNQLVALTGSPQGLVVFSVANGLPAGQAGGAASGVVSLEPGGALPALPVGSEPPTGPSLTRQSGTALTISGSPYGFGFSTAAPVGAAGPAPAETRRSAQVVRVALQSQAGTLEISNGPAYGTDILRAVALAWLLASLAAVALAALVGIAASRQFTRPVLGLTEAARRMQYGDLSVRAGLAPGRQAQEFTALAETFNLMAQRVEDTVSTLRAFVSDAAHELNTPLTALHTNLELALREPDGQQRQLFLTRAVAQNERMERLASGLLDLSRLETAHSAPDFETCDLTRLLAEVGERFASRAEQGERTFTLALPEGPLLLRGNPLQLQRVLENLLENAFKFTPPGGSIALGLESSAGQAVVSVSDSGIGIPAEDLPHLFERFHRGRNSAEYPGTGLGLAIVKAIVDLHGGQVEAHSAGRGLGSRFTIRLGVSEKTPV